MTRTLSIDDAKKIVEGAFEPLFCRVLRDTDHGNRIYFELYPSAEEFEKSDESIICKSDIKSRQFADPDVLESVLHRARAKVEDEHGFKLDSWTFQD